MWCVCVCVCVSACKHACVWGWRCMHMGGGCICVYCVMCMCMWVCVRACVRACVCACACACMCVCVKHTAPCYSSCRQTQSHLWCCSLHAIWNVLRTPKTLSDKRKQSLNHRKQQRNVLTLTGITAHSHYSQSSFFLHDNVHVRLSGPKMMHRRVSRLQFPKFFSLFPKQFTTCINGLSVKTCTFKKHVSTRLTHFAGMMLLENEQWKSEIWNYSSFLLCFLH